MYTYFLNTTIIGDVWSNVKLDFMECSSYSTKLN